MPDELDSDTLVRVADDDVVSMNVPQRIRMEYRYGKGPFTARGDIDGTTDEALALVGEYWAAWGRPYLKGVCHQFGIGADQADALADRLEDECDLQTEVTVDDLA